MIKLINFIKKLKVWHIALISIALATVIYMGAYLICTPYNNDNSDNLSSFVLDKSERFYYTNNDNDTIVFEEYSYDLYENDYKYNVPYVSGSKWYILGQISISYDYEGSINLFSINNSRYQDFVTNLSIGLDAKYNDYDLIIIDTYFSNSFWFLTFISEVSLNMYENSYFYFNFGTSNTDFTLYEEYVSFNITMQLDNYINGYYNGYDKGFNDGYDKGLGDISNDLQDAYNNGLNVGYQDGYNVGLNENSNQSLRNMLLAIFDVPLLYVKELLNFELLGVNFLGLFGAIITLGVALWILQKVL